MLYIDAKNLLLLFLTRARGLNWNHVLEVSHAKGTLYVEVDRTKNLGILSREPKHLVALIIPPCGHYSVVDYFEWRRQQDIAIGDFPLWPVRKNEQWTDNQMGAADINKVIQVVCSDAGERNLT